LRFTRRGAPGVFGREAPSGDAGALSEAATGSSRGGVRLERLPGATGLGMSRRVTIPWPVVQRFVVSQ
jgi:hypothetical protein